MATNCPFYSGNPVSSQGFIDRRQPLRRILGRVQRGESTAIVGEPRTGKTSLLLYLAAPEVRAELYGERSGQLSFAYLNTQALGGSFTQGQFWERALAAVKEEAVDPSPDSPLARQYRVCQENGFGTFTLGVLFQRLHDLDRGLVLLLDEFDLLLHHPILNSAEFFGGLRALASQSKGALALVIASNLPLARLNQETLVFNPTGSPYFNILSEIVLGAFPAGDVEALLDRAGDRFTAQDRREIRQLAGGHPFLLQAAAAILWDAYDEGIADEGECSRSVTQKLFQEQRQHFANTWRNWTPETRQAFTVVALADTGEMLPDRKFHLNELLEGLPAWQPELTDLESAGLLARQSVARSGWRVTQRIMVLWLADELMRAIRSDSSFSDWLQAAQLEGRWTRGQREQLIAAAKSLGDGIIRLVEALGRKIQVNL
jgi:hypothetical protein